MADLVHVYIFVGQKCPLCACVDRRGPNRQIFCMCQYFRANLADLVPVSVAFELALACVHVESVHTWSSNQPLDSRSQNGLAAAARIWD